MLVGLTALAGYIVVTLLQPEHLHKKSDNLVHWPVDFRVYYEAARALNSGQKLYDGNLVGNLPFTYPPFAGLIFRPLTVGDPHPMAIAWQVCSALVLLAVIIAVLRERHYSWGPGLFSVALLVWVASLNLSPVFGTFYWGQINNFLMGLIALDFLRGSRSIGRGIFSGLAAGIKLTPSFFLLPLLIQRRWIAVITMTLTALTTVVVGWIFVPDARDFWTQKVFETNRIGKADNPGAQSLAIIFERLGIEHHQLWWMISSVLIVAVFCIAVRGALRYGNFSMVFALGGVVACVISPFSWYHHWVFIVPLFVVFVDSVITAFSRVTTRFTRMGRGMGKIAWCFEQCVGLVTVAACSVIFLPFSAPVAFEPTSFRVQGRASDPIMAGLMVYTAISFVVIVAVVYGVRELIDRKRNVASSVPQS